MGHHCPIGEPVKLGHERHLAMVAWNEQEVDDTPITAISEWVLKKIADVSTMLGLSFEGSEHMA